MEIREETKARLKKIGSVGASYDAVINECIDLIEAMSFSYDNSIGADGKRLSEELYKIHESLEQTKSNILFDDDWKKSFECLIGKDDNKND